MKKRLRTIVIAFVVLGALVGAYFTALSMNAKNEPEATEAPERSTSVLVLERAKEDIEFIEFTNASGTLRFNPTIDERYNRVVWQLEGYDELEYDTSIMDSMSTPTYYFSPVEQIDPTDDNLAEYGLDRPAATAKATYYDGSVETIEIGKMTPNGEYYYARRVGTTGVYLLYSITGDRFFLTELDLIKKDFPGVYIDQLIYYKFEKRGQSVIELGYIGSEDEMQQELESYGMVTLSMLQPYPGRDVYYSNLSMYLLEPMEPFSFDSVAAVYPEDLSVYGLDDPEYEFLLIDGEESVSHLIVGNAADATRVYIMIPGYPVVYTTPKSNLDPFVNVNVFRMLDNFVSLVNIVNVDKITIDAPSRGRSHVIQLEHTVIEAEEEDGRDEEVINVWIDGETFLELPFKTYYQSLIALAYDTEIMDFEEGAEPELTIVYYLNDGKPDVTARYYPYNDHFYAVRRDEHPIQFISNIRGADTMFETLDKLLRGEIIR